MIVIAHNIRSLHNIGAIFRNAAAFGVEKLYITGYTEAPPRKEIAKVALGAERLVPWERGEVQDIIQQAKRDGYRVYALEQAEGSISLSDVGDKRVCIILGNEVEGVDQETLSAVDGCIEIPMQKKKSLNVSVASGIAMYALQNRT